MSGIMMVLLVAVKFEMAMTQGVSARFVVINKL
jgi:hypothetical protein